jgi:hypothetical protein
MLTLSGISVGLSLGSGTDCPYFMQLDPYQIQISVLGEAQSSQDASLPRKWSEDVDDSSTHGHRRTRRTRTQIIGLLRGRGRWIMTLSGKSLVGNIRVKVFYQPLTGHLIILSCDKVSG